MIFRRIVLDLYPYDLHKNAEKPGVISFLSQIFCQKAVGDDWQNWKNASKDLSFVSDPVSIDIYKWHHFNVDLQKKSGLWNFKKDMSSSNLSYSKRFGPFGPDWSQPETLRCEIFCSFWISSFLYLLLIEVYFLLLMREPMQTGDGRIPEKL